MKKEVYHTLAIMVLPDDFLSPTEARDVANEWLEANGQEPIFCDLDKKPGRNWGIMRLMREGDYEFVIVRTYYSSVATDAGHMIYKPDLIHGLTHAIPKERRDKFLTGEN